MSVRIKAVHAMLALLLATTGLSAYAQELETMDGDGQFPHGRLRVSANGRFLVHEDGTPFFWLGDTAWELFYRLNRDEVETYLDDRASKGFTVIQAVALPVQKHLDTPNRYGDCAFIDSNPLMPDVTPGADQADPSAYDWWDHVDWVIRAAADRGLYIGLLPVWGDKVNPKTGAGPEVITVATARAYGIWIGERYASFPNIIWINGGDRAPVESGRDDRPTWRELGEGIKSGDPNHLMTFHPWGEASSSQWFHREYWLDFNMYQSGHHDADFPVYNLISADYLKTPAKPAIDGEPRYEDHPIDWQPDLGRFDDADVRRSAWWSLLAGALGHTYGANDVWQFYQPAYRPQTDARHHWREALDLPGASQMIYLKNLVLSRDYLSRIPDQSIITGELREGAGHIVASRGPDYLFVYLPTGQSVTVDPAGISEKSFTAWWYSPRDGSSISIGTFPQTGSTYSFDPSGADGAGNDWVLVLDDTERGYGPPGLLP